VWCSVVSSSSGAVSYHFTLALVLAGVNYVIYVDLSSCQYTEQLARKLHNSVPKNYVTARKLRMRRPVQSTFDAVVAHIRNVVFPTVRLRGDRNFIKNRQLMMKHVYHSSDLISPMEANR